MKNLTILSGTVGSHAYGLNTSTSDIDTMSVFVTDAYDIASLNWSSKHESHHEAILGGNDTTSYEVRKFIKLLLGSHPSANELLWLDNDGYSYRTVSGNLLIENRKSFLSLHQARNAYLGYAQNQLHKFSDHPEKTKLAKHTIRLLRQGRILLETGELVLKVDNPDFYWTLAERSTGEILDIITTEFKAYDNIEKSPLPEEADIALASYLLDTIRLFEAGLRV